MTRRRRYSLILPWLLPAAIIALWEIAVRHEWLPPSTAAAPSAIRACIARRVYSGELPRYMGASLARLLLGTATGTIVGVATGALTCRFRVVDQGVSPLVQFLAGVPVVIWIPVWVMVLGTEELFKIAMVAMCTFFLVHISTVLAMRALRQGYLEVALMYEKSASQRLYEVYLPNVLPALIGSVRTSMALGWVVIFFVEYASARRGSEGLGYYIADARAVGRVEEEFAGLATLGVVAFLFDTALELFRRRKLRWADSVEAVTQPDSVR